MWRAAKRAARGRGTRLTLRAGILRNCDSARWLASDRLKRRLRSLAHLLHPRAVAGQVVGYAIAQVSAGGLGAIWLFLAAHHLSREGFGDLTLILALTSIFVVIGDLGLPISLGLHVAKRQVFDRKIFRAVIVRRIKLSLLAAFLTGVFYEISSRGRAYWIPLIFAVYLLALAVITTETITLRSLDRTYVEALYYLLSNVGILVIGYVWLSLGGKLVAAASVYGLVGVIAAILVSAVTQRHLRDDTIPPPFDEIRVRNSIAFAVASVIGTLYASIDIWLLAMLKHTVTSGGYAAAGRILAATLIPATAMGILTQNRYPRYSGREQTSFAFRLAGLAALSTFVPIAIGIAFSGQIMALVFGQSFQSDATVLRLLLCSAPAGAVILIFGLPVALRSKPLFGYLLGSGLVINIIANLLLIPHWGALGSAVANLISDIALAFMFGVALLRRVNPSIGRNSFERSGVT